MKRIFPDRIEVRKSELAIRRVEEAIQRIRRGEMLILTDDETRENEGDLVIAADHIKPASINFMAKYGRGLICLALSEDIVERLQLPLMPKRNSSSEDTAFTLSIEARYGVTTGISAHDRATTIRMAVDPKTRPQDVKIPGHVFPLRAHRNGVFSRSGQTEGSVELAKMTGLTAAAVICEVMNEDGTMARRDDLQRFREEHNLFMLSISDIVAYKIRTERLVREVAAATLPVKVDEEEDVFSIKVFESKIDGLQHIALIKEEISPARAELVRVHSSCITGDVFSSQRCDCGGQMKEALKQIMREGSGVFLYMQQEGRGIGLANKIRCYALQDGGEDTVEANQQLGFSEDLRDYGLAAQILSTLGLKTVRLMTNNPAKIVGLESYGLSVVERVPLETSPTLSNIKYLRTKKDRMGHLIEGI